MSLTIRVNPASGLRPSSVKIVQAKGVGAPRPEDAVIELNGWGVQQLITALQSWEAERRGFDDATGDSRAAA